MYRRRQLSGSWALLMSSDQRSAQPHPLPPTERRPGALRGKIWMAPDFDVLPSSLLAAMEGEADGADPGDAQ